VNNDLNVRTPEYGWRMLTLNTDIWSNIFSPLGRYLQKGILKKYFFEIIFPH